MSKSSIGLEMTQVEYSGRSVRAWFAVSVLGYGVTSDLALFGIVPYVNKRLDLTRSGLRLKRSRQGLGDISVFARYTALKRNFRGGNIRIDPFAGLKMPTGKDNERDALGLLPAVVQPGSGSWDPFAGIVLTYLTLSYQVETTFQIPALQRLNGLALENRYIFRTGFRRNY